jgi:hypothetical protein
MPFLLIQHDCQYLFTKVGSKPLDLVREPRLKSGGISRLDLINYGVQQGSQL